MQIPVVWGLGHEGFVTNPVPTGTKARVDAATNPASLRLGPVRRRAPVGCWPHDPSDPRDARRHPHLPRYALLILAGIGLSLRYVVDTAISAPVSPEGIVVMVLLAYTIFTTTLVLQRKQAARGLALGLAA